MAKINTKKKGSAYERAVAKIFRELGFSECKTSRYESQMLDDLKIDLTHTDPWAIQCKAQERGIYPHAVLGDMPDDKGIRVLFHKRNNKGTVVSLTEEDFLRIVTLVRHVKVKYPTLFKIHIDENRD